MQFKKDYRIIEVDTEFLATEKGLLRFTHTIKPDGLEKDDNGDIYATAGSFIDKDGKVTKPTVAGDSVTFETDPIGILFSTVKLTNGDAAGSIMYEGTVVGEYLPLGDDATYSEKVGQALKKKLPGINFFGLDGTLVNSEGQASEGQASEAV